MKTRRQVLGAAVTLPVLAQTHQHAPEPAGFYSPKVFSPGELDLIRDIAETIIPRTDTPGAADARVHLYIDRHYAVDKRTLAEFRQGLRLVQTSVRRGRSMTDILTDLEGHPFFQLVKDLTIDGYYSSREGLAQELEWKGYTPVAEFKGCTHKEHQD
jgi:hypothetical protein